MATMQPTQENAPFLDTYYPSHTRSFTAKWHRLSLRSRTQLRTTLPCTLHACLALHGQRSSLSACDGSVLVQRAFQLPGPGLLQCIVPEGCGALHTDAVQVAGRHCSGSSSLCVPGLPAGLNMHSFHIDGPFIASFPAPGSGAL